MEGSMEGESEDEDKKLPPVVRSVWHLLFCPSFSGFLSIFTERRRIERGGQIREKERERETNQFRHKNVNPFRSGKDLRLS